PRIGDYSARCCCHWLDRIAQAKQMLTKLSAPERRMVVAKLVTLPTWLHPLLLWLPAYRQLQSLDCYRTYDRVARCVSLSPPAPANPNNSRVEHDPLSTESSRTPPRLEARPHPLDSIRRRSSRGGKTTPQGSREAIRQRTHRDRTDPAGDCPVSTV